MPHPFDLWFVTIAMILGLSVFAWLGRQLRGTTAVAPVLWSALALISLCGTEMAVGFSSETVAPAWAASLRYCAAVLTFCPPMALLGAKRPQDGAWQFIVFSLWVILCLPVVRSLLFGMGEMAEIHVALSWFLAILIAIVATNHLLTRFAISSVLFTLGQLILFREFLPGANLWPSISTASTQLAAIGLFAASLASVYLSWPRQSLKTITAPLDRVWLDFRDLFGAAWALRVAQRINQSSAMYGWNVRLDWHGITLLEGDAISPVTETAIRESLKTILRRFVSPEWIRARLGE